MPDSVISVEDYRSRAIEGARRVATELGRRGVEVIVTGSLARGAFDHDSDIDFVVVKCPRHLKYAIEGIVEVQLGGIPFDVVYREEIPPARLHQFMDGAVPASDLR